MAATAQDLLIRIDVATEQLRRELRQADTAVERSATKMGRSLTQVDAAFSKLNLGAQRASAGVVKAMGALGVAISGAAIAQGVGSVLEHLQQVQRTAQGLGASVEAVQELTYTFRQLGLSSDDVADALNTLADRSQDAIDGTKSMVDDFGLLGITVDQLRDKDPAELFRLFAEGVANTEDPTRRAAGVVRALGDDLGRKLLPLLIQGTAGLDKYGQQAHRFNQVVGDEGVKAGSRAATALQNLQAALSGAFTQIVADNSGALADALERLTDAVGDPGVQQAVRDIATKAVNFVTHMVQALKLLHQAITDIESIDLPGGAEVAKGLLKKIIDDVPGLGQLYQAKTGVSLYDQIASVLAGKGHITAPPGSGQTMPRVKVTAPRVGASSKPGAAPSGETESAKKAREKAIARAFADFDKSVEEAAAKVATARRSGDIDIVDNKGLVIDLPDAGSRSIQEMEDQIDSLIAKGADMKQLGEDLGYAFSSSFEEAIISAQSLGGVLQGLAQDIQRILLRQFVTKPLANLIGTGVSHMAGAPAASAMGNVFDQAGIVPFARGGIVHSPTLFRFASGTGLMGEAGPEAVLPLSRGRGGKLGVLSSGGGAPTIHLSQHIDARGAEPGVEQRLAAQAARIRNEAMAGVFEAIQRGGAAYDVVRAR